MSRTLLKLGTVRTDDGAPLVRLKLVARYSAEDYGNEVAAIVHDREGM